MRQTLDELYEARVAAGTLSADPAQRFVLGPLERLRETLEETGRRKGGFVGLFAKAPPPPRGLYLWGGVGRGKSMLMDMFFAATEIERKRRVHFHAFMQEIQAGLHWARKTNVEDALEPVAQKVIAQVRLLCFDEMQITDIADAMIVGRLFEKLFAAGVVVVTTSNRAPEALYENGLNRALFLPFISLISERMDIHALQSPTDYRRQVLGGAQVYFQPANTAARAEMARIWHELTGGGSPEPLRLTVKGRDVVVPAFLNGIARASFWDFCAQPLGPGDYLAIAEAVQVLLLEDIPTLSSANYNEAKRFVTLIDALYEAKVRLICSAADLPERLYLEGTGSFEFERTASRLREMQGADWGRT